MRKNTPESASLFQRHQELKSQFVDTEIDLAITLCELAQSSHDEEKARGHAAAARRAYEGARHMIEDRPAGMLPDEERSEKVRRLEGMLEDLPQ